MRRAPTASSRSIGPITGLRRGFRSAFSAGQWQRELAHALMLVSGQELAPHQCVELDELVGARRQVAARNRGGARG